MNINHSAILLFDGECNLCNSSVQFVLRHDRRQVFVFGSLQSEAAQKLLADVHFTRNVDSVVVLINNHVYTESTAALNIFRLIGGWWTLLYAVIIVPPFIRNAVYKYIARNRYRWFGRREQCMVPTEELKKRFLT